MPRNHVFASLLILLLASISNADVTLPAVIDNHMVLQRDMPVPVWGWADPGEAVSVSFNGENVKTKAGDKGNWMVTLKALKANRKAQKMTIKGNNEIVLKDILIGEVWIGSGQSNMEWPINRAFGSKEAVAAVSKYPAVRLLHVRKVQNKAPQKDINAQMRWTAGNAKNVPGFSAALYYFGRRLHRELKVPVGLINSSWGGSPIGPWTVKGSTSGGMYNAMIHPLKPFALRGTIWYQGETNVIKKNGLAYTGKMRDLIEGWRKAWGHDLSFYYVQIAPWSGGRYAPGELPALWEAQAATLKLPKTGMIVTTDLVDNIKDIHPKNKVDIGVRLVRWALVKDYGKKNLAYSGPLYKSMKVEGDKIYLTFAHAKGMKSRDKKPLTEFQIAGSDGQFAPAVAKISGQTIVVQSKEVSAPTQVRFGWHKLANPNLVNAEGLPASPFQTNNWTGGTGE